MSSATKTQAIILKKKEILEKDSIITVLTYDLGKINLIAKGIKKMTSRRAPHLQTGNLLNIHVNIREHANYLDQTELISAFSDIRADQNKLNYLYAFFFVVDRILPEQQQEQAIFALTKRFLIDLAKREQVTSDFLREYLQSLLETLGYSYGEKTLTDLIRIAQEIINEKIPLHAIM